ncbi:hypothetical protein DFH06DRAFT_1332471 [Mycena polygramma]|nr:hypothetical protein DFH06DRAFT_1332471 [Mycena polygramma]
MNSLHCHHCGAPEPSDFKGGLSDFQTAPGTRHHTLLNSNEAPLGPDVAIIKSTISKIDKHLAELDVEIERLQERMRELQNEWALLSHYRDRNHGVLSPVRRIPPEVLGEIFSWTSRKMRMKDSPWLFTHVSQYWRAVAVSHSKLWSLVAIKYQPETDPSAYPLAMVETQLARAKKLKIHFSGCQISNAGPQTEMFRYLSKHASRWEELSLVLTSDLYPILNDLRGRVPSLCRVSIRWDREESRAGADSIHFLESAPSLVDVDVLNKHRYVPVSLPSQQLTRYRLDAPWEIHEGLLKLASNLVEAGISVKSSASLWPESDVIINLASVRRLYASTPQVFRRIRVPALEELAMNFGSHRATVAGDLKSLVARSACNLRRICLAGCCHAPTNISILQNFPSAVELRIIITKDSVARAVNKFIERLIVLPGSTPVIPHLSSLSLAPTMAASDSCFDYAAHFKMAESRWSSQECALSHAALIFRTPPIPGPPSFTDFDILRNDGFNFVLVTNAVEAISIANNWACFTRFGTSVV